MAKHLKADLFISGHIHQTVLEKRGATVFLNPGSAALSKRADGRNTVAVLEDGKIRIFDIDTGDVLHELALWLPSPDYRKEIHTHMKDHLVKAVADGVRVYAAVTTDLVNEAIRRHGCHAVAAAALGRTMTGALLLAANLKNREALTITFDGHGPLGKVTADATPEGFVRGYVTNPYVDLPQNAKGKIDVGGGVGTDGTVTVTRFTGLRNPVTGSAPLTDGEIADDLTKYLYVSEQTPSSVGLGVLIGHAGEKMACIGAGGFIIQPMPDATDETIDKLEANLKKVNSVSHMVEHGLDAKGIIAELLQGFAVDYLTTTDLAFRCQCSKERISEVLLSLGKTDLASLIEDGHAEVCCHFCNERYAFSKEELQAIYDKAMAQRQQADS